MKYLNTIESYCILILFAAGVLSDFATGLKFRIVLATIGIASVIGMIVTSYTMVRLLKKKRG